MFNEMMIVFTDRKAPCNSKFPRYSLTSCGSIKSVRMGSREPILEIFMSWLFCGYHFFFFHCVFYVNILLEYLHYLFFFVNSALFDLFMKLFDSDSRI